MIYCIEIERELEDKDVIHHDFETHPITDEVIVVIEEAGYIFKKGYDKTSFYPVVTIKLKK